MNSHSEVECRYILLSVVVSGCPMEGEIRSLWGDCILAQPFPELPSLVINHHHPLNLSTLTVKKRTVLWCVLLSVVGQRLHSVGHGDLRSLWGDCILALLYTQLPLLGLHGRRHPPPSSSEIVCTQSDLNTVVLFVSSVCSGIQRLLYISEEGTIKYPHTI
jgi:hypothetical protein